jgi:hypothetical protein
MPCISLLVCLLLASRAPEIAIARSGSTVAQRYAKASQYGIERQLSLLLREAFDLL